MNALAKEFHVHIVYGMAEKEEDILYNSQFFLDDTGVLLGTYRKVHLFDSEKIILHLGINLKYLIQRSVVSACLSVMTHSFQKLPEFLIH